MTAQPLATEIQSLSHAPYIELFTLDTSPIYQINGVPNGGAQYNWTPGTIGDAAIVFGGVTYSPMPVAFTNMKTTGQGTPPTPVLRVSAIGGLIASLIGAEGDLVGATVTRLRTFSEFLDGQPEADPAYFFGPDTFSIDQKVVQTKNYTEFRLAVSYDQAGIRFPKRQILRDSCTHSYRYYNTTTSAFVAGNCPYTGGSYYTAAGVSTSDPTQDACGKRLSDCLLRYPNNQPLPTWAFPGAALAGIGGG
jgi:lambda family phage minor tail protein L